jgi:hypothetical protein
VCAGGGSSLPPAHKNNFILTKSNMKNQFNSKQSEQAAMVERKHQPARGGSKTFVHRYERRKIREQLRQLDWALAGVD